MHFRTLSSLAVALLFPLACGGGSGPAGDGDGDGGALGTGAMPGSGAQPGGGTTGSGAQGSGGTGGDSEVGTGGSESSQTGGNENGSGGEPPVEIPDEVACAPVEAENPIQIDIKAEDIRADNQNGLTFKGFGVLTANSTSGVLLDYKYRQPEKYAQLLQILFGGWRPIMTHVKIEMGNDSNNSTGPDPATQRSSTEAANVRRAPGFQLAADAKTINPDIKVSLLRWHAPAWVGSSNDNLYTWFKNTILAAYREYGYMVDYVNPGENERAPNLTWTRDYAQRVHTDKAGFADATEQALYNEIQIMISDEVQVGSFGGTLVSDAGLRDAVSAAGFHYSTDDDAGGNFTRLAEEFDLQIWNSEAQATFSNSAFRPNNNTRDPSVVGTGIGGTNGPLEMGNTIIKGFDRSRRTHFIYQPAIGAFYEGGQFSHKELVSARDPWSGWIHYDAGLDVLRHFSWFAETGWENESNDRGIWRVVPQATDTGATGTNPVNGRNGSPSYLTLAAPDKKDFSVVIVNDSEQTKYYSIGTADMDLPSDLALEVWETRAAAEDEAFNENYLKYLCDLSRIDGNYVLSVRPWSVVTVSTLENRKNQEFNRPLPVEGERWVLDTDASGHERDTSDNVLYADDFDYGALTVADIGDLGEVAGMQAFIDSRGGPKSTIPRYTWDRNGAFEGFVADGSTNGVLRQQGNMGTAWNPGEPLTAIGDKSWLNYRASVDVTFESTNGDRNYAGIGARQQGGAQSHTYEGTPFTLRLWQDGGWYVNRFGTTLASGSMAGDGYDTSPGTWHNLAIEVAGSTVTAFIDGEEVHSFTDASHLSGRVDLLSGPVNVQFDDLLVETVEGQPAYYIEYLDNLQMHDLSPERAAKLSYEGGWAHALGQDMYNYHRSLSTSTASGATLTYTFEGSGIDILGPNNGTAKLEVTVDGQVKEASASTMSSDNMYQTFALRGLATSEHTVTFKVLSGTLVVDAIGIVP